MERKITALKVQKRDPSRINVDLDGEFAFGVSRLVGAWLSVGQSLDEQKIEKLVQDDAAEKAFQKALKFLDYRIRSETEIRKKLQSAGYDEDLIGKIIQRLLDGRLAGDSSFARNWVENRSTFRPRSRRMLQMELRQKGVDEALITEALDNAPGELDLAIKLARKYVYRLRDADKQNFTKKMTEYLLRKGFDYSTAKEVVVCIWSEHLAELDTSTKLTNKEEDNV